jgi:hypothetical protein
MRKPNATQRIFQDRFIAEAENRLGMGRYSRGFMTEVEKSSSYGRSAWFSVGSKGGCRGCHTC